MSATARALPPGRWAFLGFRNSRHLPRRTELEPQLGRSEIVQKRLLVARKVRVEPAVSFQQLDVRQRRHVVIDRQPNRLDGAERNTRGRLLDPEYVGVWARNRTIVSPCARKFLGENETIPAAPAVSGPAATFHDLALVASAARDAVLLLPHPLGTENRLQLRIDAETYEALIDDVHRAVATPAAAQRERIPETLERRDEENPVVADEGARQLELAGR